MVRSEFCRLNQLSRLERTQRGECEYDEGGYFIINGGEKVMIAQEKQASNKVYVFHKKQPSKHSFVANLRSTIDSGSKMSSTFAVAMLTRSPGSGAMDPSGQCMHASIPFIRKGIPIVVLFRALGRSSDRDIYQLICYDFEDNAMMEKLKASFEEGYFIRVWYNVLDFRHMIG